MDPNIEVERLVEDARRGDQDAWGSLLGALYPRLHAFTGNRVPPAFVEDLVSETMTRAVSGIGRFRWGAAGFDGWVFGIARHVIADHYRSSSRERKYLVPEPSRVQDADHVPGDAIELGEEHAHLRQCFAQLNESERQLLELRVIAGLTSEQTAAVLGKRPGAVRSAQSRALTHLRQLMEHDDG